MRKTFILLLLGLSVIVFTSSVSLKERNRYYRDSNGNKTVLQGGWKLVEVQYWTAGVVESKEVNPGSWMEFRENGIGATRSVQADGSIKEINTFRYDKAPGGVTFYTEEEYENNRNLGVDDSRYERGKTYYFKVIDENTISSKENVSSGTWVVNVFSRYDNMHMEELKINKIEALRGIAPQDVPALFDEAGVKFNDIACDDWNWSDRNPKVQFRVAHCGDALAIHFHVSDNELRAVAVGNGGRVWEDSCCEFFVSPESDDFYYNFECSCIGTLWLHGGRKGTDRPEAPECAYDSVKRWSSVGCEPFEAVEKDCEWDLVEIIPASALFMHDIKDFSGMVMAANFYKCGDLLPHPHYLSWAPITLPQPAFHCPEFFRKISFE